MFFFVLNTWMWMGSGKWILISLSLIHWPKLNCDPDSHPFSHLFYLLSLLSSFQWTNDFNYCPFQQRVWNTHAKIPVSLFLRASYVTWERQRQVLSERCSGGKVGWVRSIRTSRELSAFPEYFNGVLCSLTWLFLFSKDCVYLGNTYVWPCKDKQTTGAGEHSVCTWPFLMDCAGVIWQFCHFEGSLLSRSLAQRVFLMST